MIKETMTFTFDNADQQKRFHERLRGEPWSCAARNQGTAGGNDAADCDWPTCGCDSHATSVMIALHESGWLSPDEKNAYAIKVREQVLREVRAGNHAD